MRADVCASAGAGAHLHTFIYGDSGDSLSLEEKSQENTAKSRHQNGSSILVTPPSILVTPPSPASARIARAQRLIGVEASEWGGLSVGDTLALPVPWTATFDLGGVLLVATTSGRRLAGARKGQEGVFEPFELRALVYAVQEARAGIVEARTWAAAKLASPTWRLSPVQAVSGAIGLLATRGRSDVAAVVPPGAVTMTGAEFTERIDAHVTVVLEEPDDSGEEVVW